jgi:hypothetical protein
MKTTNYNIELPNQFLQYDEETQQLILTYLNGLTDIQKKAYIIAKHHLGSSFNIIKSNGFIDWKKNHK